MKIIIYETVKTKYELNLPDITMEDFEEEFETEINKFLDEVEGRPFMYSDAVDVAYAIKSKMELDGTISALDEETEYEFEYDD